MAKAREKKPGAAQATPEAEEKAGFPVGKAVAAAFSISLILGLGWGLMTLFGYYWLIVDLAAAPQWAVIVAFVSMPVTSVVLGFIIFDGSVIEVGVKMVLILPGAYIATGWTPWLDTIIFSVGCGLAAAAMTAVASKLLFKNRVKE